MRIQIGALPFRIDGDDGLRILLVTSKPVGDRWTLPKGNRIKGLTPQEVALREAFEEAGVRGEITTRKPLGRYRHEKRLGDDRTRGFDVRIYPLRVACQAQDWPERGQREVRWFAPRDAAAAVSAEGLGELIELFAAQGAGLEDEPGPSG